MLHALRIVSLRRTKLKLRVMTFQNERYDGGDGGSDGGAEPDGKAQPAPKSKADSSANWSVSEPTD